MNGLALIHRLTERLKAVNPRGAQGELRWILKTWASTPILDLSLDEASLSDRETADVERAVERRIAGEPLAYILKEAGRCRVLPVALGRAAEGPRFGRRVRQYPHRDLPIGRQRGVRRGGKLARGGPGTREKPRNVPFARSRPSLYNGLP
jgi:hypothetical protein